MTIKEEKEYQSPEMKVIMLLHEGMICGSNDGIPTETEEEINELP